MKKLLLLSYLILPLFVTAQAPKEYWEWVKSIGGTGDDVAADFKLRHGYIYITGTFTSPSLNWDNTTLSNHGGRDIFIAKIDSSGNTVWVKSFGGSEDDSVSVLEINKNNQFVLLCKSGSSSIEFSNDTLVSPQNFYLKFDEDGNLLQGRVLPYDLEYTDIDIDNDGGVYAACNYRRSFVFAGKTVDLNDPVTPPIGAPVIYPFPNSNVYMYPVTGPSPDYLTSAALLKFGSAGNELWMKLFHSRPQDLQIACDTANIFAMFVHRGATDYDSTFFTDNFFYGNTTNVGSYPGDNMTVVLSKNGVTQRVINDQDYTSKIYDFHFAANGLGYAASSYYINIFGSSNPDYDGANLKEFKNGTMGRDLLNSCIGTVLPSAYSCQNSVPYNIASAQVSQNAKLLINDNNTVSNFPNIVYVVDSSFTRLDSLHVPNADSISLASKAMDDSAVYFMHNFTNSNININNNNYPGLPLIHLSSAGNKDIFLGRYHRRGYLPLAFKNFDSTIKFCNGDFYLNLQDTNILYYHGARNRQYHWEPAANFYNPGSLSTGVNMASDTLTARLFVSDGIDTISRTIFLRKGILTDLQLHLSDSVACGNGSIEASLTGSQYDTCMVTSLCDGNTWPFYYLAQVNNILLFHFTPVPACDSVRAFRLEMMENSNYCADTSVHTVRIKPYDVLPMNNVYVCPGSSYTLSNDTTYTNIRNEIYRYKKFVNQYGCDSVVPTHITPLPYGNLEKAYVCEGGSYTFPDGTTLTNIAYQPSNTDPLGTPYQRTRTIPSVYGCDSIIINTYLYVNRKNAVTNTVRICAGSNYTFADGTVFNNIQSDTAYTAHLTNVKGCDSAVTTVISILSQHLNTYASICKGGNYVFPDGMVITNIAADTSYTCRFFAINGCDSFVTSHVTVLPTYDLFENDSICSGSSYVFPDHVRINNITSDLSYTSHLTTFSGCDSIITTNLTVLPTYHLVENAAVCKGNSYTFPDGVQVNNILSDLSYVSNLECNNTITTNITVISNDTSVTKNRSTLTASLSDARYQWIDCSNNSSIPSETNQAYTATQVGSYAVQLEKNGCTDTSACYDISAEDLLRPGNSNVSVAPNPAGSTVRVQYVSAAATQVSVVISDLFGQRVKQENRQVAAGVNNFEIDITSLVRGIYLLTFYDQGRNTESVKRIVKN